MTGLRALLGRVLRSGGSPPGGPPATADAAAAARARRDHRSGVQAPAGSAPYPGDFRGIPAMSWAPQPDGQPDPGEIVWTWVPFEEDHSVGKDRPVLLVGVDGDWLLGVALTSKDHDVDAAQEAREGRQWVDIGSGGWDREGRPSEVRVNRIVRVDPARVRREGAVVAAEVFEQVADAIRGDAPAGH